MSKAINITIAATTETSSGLLSIGQVWYINIPAWLRGFWIKIANFPSFLCPSIPKRDRYKENNTKYRGLTWKPRSHVRILIYRTWPIITANILGRDGIQKCANVLVDTEAQVSLIRNNTALTLGLKGKDTSMTIEWGLYTFGAGKSHHYDWLLHVLISQASKRRWFCLLVLVSNTADDSHEIVWPDCKQCSASADFLGCFYSTTFLFNIFWPGNNFQ